MASDSPVRRYRNWYAKLLRLYPKQYYARFGEGMEQVFNDLLCECARENRGLFFYALWMFFETSVGIFRNNITSLFMKNRNLFIIALVTAAILMIPFVAMRYTDEVIWTLGDFIFMGTLLFGTGLVFDLIARRSKSTTYKWAAGIAAIATILLVWVNAAVGIIGNGPVNLLYLCVILIGITGAFVSSLKPDGMSRTLFAMTVGQMVVPMIALYFVPAEMAETPGTLGVFALNGFFAMMWVVSGLLFRRSQ